MPSTTADDLSRFIHESDMNMGKEQEHEIPVVDKMAAVGASAKLPETL